ncbi:peptidoglycan DD-metalloendopeptidase family protein [Erythrobacter vulgaris]|uniref:Peptidoglycan DD-metalloendopeptidase family protein n=1 Tax=Qipengyuania vulgaris TaxID=291985 RepID=A0A844XRP8_9SPHN|nr:peptidoglycan DD-metalloendopeptidase family protein [Qipengyuania vulgaris]MXO48049.1 peptidoglycan DD-metalloendopeptidase family protein [Qipengyuania vulgaris]
MNRAAILLVALFLVIILGAQGLAPLTAQQSSSSARNADAREAFEIARLQQRNARLRAELLEAEAQRAANDSEKAISAAAALAARVQQAEARVAAAEAELSMVERQRRALSRDLAQRREPLAQLTGALETMARRPLVLAAFQPGSLSDVVHTRAVLASAVPVVRQRTTALRSDLERTRQLAADRRSFLADRRRAEQALVRRRADMLALAETERILAQQAAGGANREAELAVELAEEARDLDALVIRLDKSASLRQRLAKLDGPLVRPAQPAAARLPSPRNSGAASVAGAPEPYLLPVAGRITAGFGEIAEGGRSSGVTIRPRAEAQVIAPAAGRVGFAGQYEGYGRIVILEHKGGWTSIVTGLGDLAVGTGQQLGAGSPMGLAPRTNPEIALELRREGAAVNPLDQLR